MCIIKNLFNKIGSIDDRFNNRGLYPEFGNDEPTINDFNKLIIQNPSWRFIVGRGRAYGRIRQYQKAIKDLTQALRLTEDEYSAITVYLIRGSVYWASGEYENAMDDFTKTIDLNPNGAEYYFNRGWHYDALGQHQLAIQDFDEAIRLNPDFAHAYNCRGGCYESLNDYEQMCRDFRKAVELGGDPTAFNAAKRAGVCQ